MEHSVDPDIYVVRCAAVQAGLITGESGGQIFLDVSAPSLGVKTLDMVDSETNKPDYFSTFVRRNTRIPVSRAEVYRSIVDRQRAKKTIPTKSTLRKPFCSCIGAFWKMSPNALWIFPHGTRGS